METLKKYWAMLLGVLALIAALFYRSKSKDLSSKLGVEEADKKAGITDAQIDALMEKHKGLMQNLAEIERKEKELKVEGLSDEEIADYWNKKLK